MRVFYRDLSPSRVVYHAITNTACGEQSFVIGSGSVVMFDRCICRMSSVANRYGGLMKAVGRLSQRVVFVGESRERIIKAIFPAETTS